jgi:tetratricopeptide (TPR) repeat protein
MRRFGSRLATAFALAAALAAANPASPAEGAAAADEAAALLESTKAEDFERAAKIYEASAAQHPDDFDARARAAQALTQLMAVRTNGNLPLVDGLQDTDANRALWADLGKRALEHARAAEKLSPQHAGAAALVASSYMFYASSLGIIRSILQGAGNEYKAHAQRLVDLDPNYDDALGSSLLANFYLIAPWPIHDRDAALEHFERAAKIAPASVRNQYGLAVFWARDGDAARARSYFERAVSMPCTPHTERLFCDWIKANSKRELAKLAAR